MIRTENNQGFIGEFQCIDLSPELEQHVFCAPQLPIIQCTNGRRIFLRDEIHAAPHADPVVAHVLDSFPGLLVDDQVVAPELCLGPGFRVVGEMGIQDVVPEEKGFIFIVLKPDQGLEEVLGTAIRLGDEFRAGHRVHVRGEPQVRIIDIGLITLHAGDGITGIPQHLEGGIPFGRHMLVARNHPMHKRTHAREQAVNVFTGPAGS